jgi:hypothetical protein
MSGNERDTGGSHLSADGEGFQWRTTQIHVNRR